ncbi:hypothetical protein [Brevundimonas sp.]|uniref:hypothetical protein n=1 Tax=Brevundimonas sp. TaxID=1871086 RepID=UPI002D6044FD|nr:hypothetical protein [Brevundimonas sp.]HYC66902.1 hypothetical protein [Brevundimonas sp.]
MADEEPPRRRTRTPRPEPGPPTPARKDEVKTAGWRITEAGAAVAAFLLSLSIFLLGAFQSIRGAEIVLLPPQTVLLYRDAPTPDSDVLMLAMETGMINTARADYGDVAVQAYAESAGDVAAVARFPYDASVEPVQHPVGEERTSDCPIDARCVSATGLKPPKAGRLGLVVIERRPELLSVPGGSSHSTWLAFSFANCRGQSEACDRYSSFTDALQQLRVAPELSFRVTLDFHSDGRKTFLCAFDNDAVGSREAFLDFLEERGWATLRCRRELRS